MHSFFHGLLTAQQRRCITVSIGKTRLLRLRHFKNSIQGKTRTWTHLFLAPKSMLLTVMQCGLPGSARIQISDLNSTNCEYFKFSLILVRDARLGGNFPDTERMYYMQICPDATMNTRTLRTGLILILEFRFDSSYSLCFTDSSFKSPHHAHFLAWTLISHSWIYFQVPLSRLSPAHLTVTYLAHRCQILQCHFQVVPPLLKNVQVPYFHWSKDFCTILKTPFTQILY